MYKTSTPSIEGPLELTDSWKLAKIATVSLDLEIACCLTDSRETLRNSC